MTTAASSLDQLRNAAIDGEFARRTLWHRIWDGLRRRAGRSLSWLSRAEPQYLACQRAMDWVLGIDAEEHRAERVSSGADNHDRPRHAKSDASCRAAMVSALAAVEYGHHAAAQRWASAAQKYCTVETLAARVAEFVATAARHPPEFITTEVAAGNKLHRPIGWLDELSAQIGDLLDEIEALIPAEDPSLAATAVSTLCLARSAASAFRSDDCELLPMAQGIVRGLARWQSAEGWLPERVTLEDVSARGEIRMRPYESARCDDSSNAGRLAATGAFLIAASWQVRAAMAHSDADLRPSIAQDDGRLQTVLAWAADVAAGGVARKHPLEARCRIADLGCGAGRYLRQISRVLPEVDLVGIDASSTALSSFPGNVAARQGDLRRLPAQNGEFDGAFCVEALEHSLTPRHAVAEICRSVRPGGAVLIIDKNSAHQSLSDCRRWERWFTPLEIVQWLSPLCSDVKAAPIPHGRHQRPTGLFYCWTGRRRMT